MPDTFLFSAVPLFIVNIPPGGLLHISGVVIKVPLVIVLFLPFPGLSQTVCAEVRMCSVWHIPLCQVYVHALCPLQLFE